MKPRVEKPNPFLLLNRAKKVAALVIDAEKLAKECGIPMLVFVERIRRWEDWQWNTLAVKAGQNPPSEDSKRDVIAMLRERMRKAVA